MLESVRHQRRITAFHTGIAMCGVAALVYAGLLYALGDATGASIAAWASATFALLRALSAVRGATLGLRRAFVTVLAVSVVAVTMRTGGTASINAIWFVLVPLSAFLVLGRRGFLFFTGVALAAVTTCSLARLNGMEVNYVIPIAARNLYESVSMVGGLATMLAFKGSMLFHAERQELAAHEATRQALAAARARENFLATMSHEIRTPLHGMLGTTDLLLESPLGQAERDYALAAKSSGQTLLALLNDILDFSKLEAGAVQIEQIPVDLEEVLVDCIHVVKRAPYAGGLYFMLDLVAPGGAWVRSDPTRLRQILLNLLTNAAKFTHEGGITVHVRPGDEGWHIEVRDTGVGIPEDRIDKVFEVFTQADETTTRNYGGTGLGLSLVRGLVEAMNGRIRLKSTVGVGTTVALDLPLPSLDVPAPEPVPFRVAALGNRPLSRELLARTLQGRVTEVRVIEDAADAVGSDVVVACLGDLSPSDLPEVPCPVVHVRERPLNTGAKCLVPPVHSSRLVEAVRTAADLTQRRRHNPPRFERHAGAGGRRQPRQPPRRERHALQAGRRDEPGLQRPGSRRLRAGHRLRPHRHRLPDARHGPLRGFAPDPRPPRHGNPHRRPLRLGPRRGPGTCTGKRYAGLLGQAVAPGVARRRAVPLAARCLTGMLPATGASR